MLDAEVPSERDHGSRASRLASGNRRAERPAHPRRISTQAYWRFTADRRRTRTRAARRTRRCGTVSPRRRRRPLKAAYFSTLRDVALTRPTVSWLTAVWREDERVPGLTLSEADYVAMAKELAVRAVPGLAGDPRPADRANEEPRPQGSADVRHAGVVVESGRARRAFSRR